MLAKVVASVVTKLTLQSGNRDLIQDIERNSQIFDRVQDGFSQLLDRHTFTVWSFTEELPMIGIVQVIVLLR